MMATCNRGDPQARELPHESEGLSTSHFAGVSAGKGW
jgi:hypothetical protein